MRAGEKEQHHKVVPYKTIALQARIQENPDRSFLPPFIGFKCNQWGSKPIVHIHIYTYSKYIYIHKKTHVIQHTATSGKDWN